MSSTVISHSEVDSFLACKQRHYYAFGMLTNVDQKGLQPKVYSDSLYRGIIGHLGLETFFAGIFNDMTIKEASTAALDAIRDCASSPDANYEILTDLSTRLLPRYFDEKATELLNSGWKVKAVEKVFKLEVSTEFGNMVYPFKPDLIMASPYNEYFVIDHKFLYNFYTQNDVSLLPQIPKYVGSLRSLGFPIKGGFYNIIRWRTVKDTSADSMFKFMPMNPSDERVSHAFKSQLDTMLRIKKYKEGDLEEWRKSVDKQRVLNSMVCKNCPFKKLCDAEINGSNIDLLVKIDYEPNDYGYDKNEGDD